MVDTITITLLMSLKSEESTDLILKSIKLVTGKLSRTYENSFENLSKTESYIVKINLKHFTIFTDHMRRTQKRGVINTFEHLLHNSVCDGTSYNDM